MKKLVAIFLVAAAVGCATTKNWQATGGSRSDGVVRLSYEYGAFESPRLDDAEAMALAQSRCKVWGYSDAEPFGGVTQVCNNASGYGCNRWMVTKEFQCTGADRPQ